MKLDWFEKVKVMDEQKKTNTQPTSNVQLGGKLQRNFVLLWLSFCFYYNLSWHFTLICASMFFQQSYVTLCKRSVDKMRRETLVDTLFFDEYCRIKGERKKMSVSNNLVMELSFLCFLSKGSRAEPLGQGWI